MNLVRQFVPDYNNRDACLDYARIIAAFLVIYGHLFTPSFNSPVRIFIYQFHMPFFFLISGMLHKYNGTIQIVKYFKTIIVPYVFFQTLMFLFVGLVYHFSFWGVEYSGAGDNLFLTYYNYFTKTIRIFIRGGEMFNGPCWFLIALFYCKVFFDIAFKNRIVGFIVWFLLWMGFCYYKHTYFYISNFAMAMPFYVAGYCLKPYVNKLKFMKYRWLMMIFCCAAVLTIMHLNGNVSSYGIQFGHLSHKYYSVPLFYMTGLCGSLMMLLGALYLTKSSPYSVLLGTALISVLGFQAIFIYIVDKTIGLNRGYIESLFEALAIFVICILLHLLFLRFTPALLGKPKNKS